MAELGIEKQADSLRADHRSSSGSNTDAHPGGLPHQAAHAKKSAYTNATLESALPIDSLRPQYPMSTATSSYPPTDLNPSQWMRPSDLTNEPRPSKSRSLDVTSVADHGSVTKKRKLDHRENVESGQPKMATPTSTAGTRRTRSQQAASNAGTVSAQALTSVSQASERLEANEKSPSTIALLKEQPATSRS